MDELMGKRMLLKVSSTGYFGSGAVEEYRVLEVSPSGGWVKLQNSHGNKFWRAKQEIAVVEELKPLNFGKPKD